MVYEHERPADSAEEKPAMVTWDEYAAGAPCPGCGLPYRDDEKWASRGTMHFTPEQRERYDAEEARFQRDHGDCHTSKFSAGSSLINHCKKCCPPPPFSPDQIETIARVFREARAAKRQGLHHCRLR